MAFRFLHLADLHLETCFGGNEATRARLRAATHEAFHAAVDLARERGLDAVLLAGDVFDDPLLSRRAELSFLRGLRRLAEHGVTVVIVTGNHDPGAAGKRMARLGLERDDDWRARVHLLRGARPEVVRVPGRDGAPAGVVVGAGHASEREERNLAAQLTPLEAEVPVVGLLHTQVHAARASAEHMPYAPCAHADLAHLGYDYFALGHVHLRQRPFEDLPAWYSGNLQGRNPRETGPKGGLLVELRPGEPVEPEFVPLAPVVWERARVEDLGACETSDDLLDHLTGVVRRHVESADGREVVLLLELAGTSRAARWMRDAGDRAAFAEELAAAGGALEVCLRADALRPLRDLERLRAVPSVLAQALELVEMARGDPGVLAEIAPEELAGVADDEDRQAYLAGLLEGLEHELCERCLEPSSLEGGA